MRFCADALGCCRFLTYFTLLAEALIVVSGLDTDHFSPYSFDSFFPEDVRPQSSEDPRESVILMALRCSTELLRLLGSHEWLDDRCRRHPPVSKDESGAERRREPRDKEDVFLMENSHMFNVETCFKPLFVHYRDPIVTTPSPVRFTLRLLLCFLIARSDHWLLNHNLATG